MIYSDFSTGKRMSRKHAHLIRFHLLQPRLLPGLIGGLALVSAVPSAYAQQHESSAFRPFVVQDIRVEGLQRTEPGTIFTYLPIKVGETVDTEKVSEAIRALFATGFFKDVRIEGASEDEALALIEHHQYVEKVLNIIDDIRNLIRSANAAGKISFGPRRIGRGKRDDETPSTLHLLSDLTAVDAVVCDEFWLDCG